MVAHANLRTGDDNCLVHVSERLLQRIRHKQDADGEDEARSKDEARTSPFPFDFCIF